MAGEQFNGTLIRNFKPKESAAFCEGMAYRLSGTAIGAPIVDNPYSDPDGGIEAAWDAGWNSANADTGGALIPLCCALEGTVLA